MGNSRHIFIQIDTNSIIALNNPKPKNEDVRAHTLIYDQGSLALGNAVKNFTINVQTGQEIHFSIVPLELFSYAKLYFTGFLVTEDTGIELPSQVKPDTHVLSFSIPIGNVQKNGTAVFCLNAVLETQEGKKIDICIDPRLQTEQGGG
ncbi:MAG: hypothetical protein ABJF11_11360 [Reichenbachiella sp.]|uniref:hypothetical protein n=1 Tax=Reichenbachiella sp. TaxID=2184521 RepID=UPI0032673024